jgi:hypothetical protein
VPNSEVTQLFRCRRVVLVEGIGEQADAAGRR